MDKVVPIEDVVKISKKLHEQQKKIVVVGGCFDVVHLGHTRFLQRAKLLGDIQIVLLESDQKVKQLKGHNRPIYTQKDRAEVLAEFESVNYIILLPPQMTNASYDKLILEIKPAIIATTEGDINRSHKERQAAMIGAVVTDVIERVEGKSTSDILKNL